MSLTPETITWAYRLFLDREPESTHVVEEKLERLRDTRTLRQEFVGSEEFRRINRVLSTPVLSGNEPPLEVEDRLSQAQLDALFEHVQETWQHLGETEPYFSVITSDAYKRARFQEEREAFFGSGTHNVRMLFDAMKRVGIDPSGFRSCLDFGCGVGRVSRYLADRFDQVIGCDISSAHLEVAEGYLREENVDNVTLRHLCRVEDVRALPQVDVIYSVLVLQHNPPPIIAEIIAGFLRTLRPGGIAFFQLPTYRVGYRFALDPYLRDEAPRNRMEMHLLPQHRVFEILADHGARLLEVLENHWTGAWADVSNTFVVAK